MPLPKRRRREEEDDDDRPQKKKKKKKPEGLGMLPIILGGAGGVLLLLIIVGVVVALAVGGRGGDKRGGVPNTPLAVDGGKAGKKGAGSFETYLINYDRARSRLDAAESKMAQVMNQGVSFRPQLEEVRSIYNSVRAESSTWSPAEGSSAKQLHQCFQEYLTLYESQIQWGDQTLSVIEANSKNPFQKSPLPPRPNKDAFENKRRELNNLASSLSRGIGP